MLKRRYSIEEPQFSKKNRKGSSSPVSVADTQSTTTSPRTVTPSMPLHMGMMGLSLKRPSELEMEEEEEEEDVKTCVDRWVLGGEGCRLRESLSPSLKKKKHCADF